MKKIITIITMLLGVISINAQSNLPYKPLSQFNKDTTAFILYNFMDRAEQYKGKTLKEVARDLQIPIKDLIRDKNFKKRTINGLYIEIYNENRIKQMENQDMIDNTINIRMDISLNWERDLRSLIVGKTPKVQKQIIYDYFKDFKIKSVHVLIPPKNALYQKYKNKIPSPYDEYSLNDGKLIDVDCTGSTEYNKIYYGQIHNHMKHPTSYSIYFKILKKMRIRINHEYKDYSLSPLRILKSSIKDVNTGEEYQLSNTQLSHELYNSTIEIEPGTYVYKSFLDAYDSAVWLRISNKCGGSDADDDDDDYVENSSTFNMGNLNKAGSFVRSLSLEEMKELTFTFNLDTTTDLKFQCSSTDIVSLNTAMKNISLVNLQGYKYNPGDSDIDENFYGLWFNSLPKGTYTFKCTITPENIPSKLYFYFTEE